MLFFKPIACLLSLAALILPGAAPAQQSQPPNGPSSTAAVQQAERLLSAGQSDAAIKILTTVSGAESNDPQISHLLGLAYYQKADYARAIEQLSLAVKLKDEAGRQYRQDVQMLGLSHYLLGHIKEAIPYLEQVKNF